MYKNLTILTL